MENTPRTPPQVLTTPPHLEFLFRCSAHCDPPVNTGLLYGGGTGEAARVLYPITGGELSGEVEGVIMPGGGDWDILLADGCFYADTRYTVKTYDGATLYFQNAGNACTVGAVDSLSAFLKRKGRDVDDSVSIFRSQLKIETGDPRYAYLSRLTIIGAIDKVGARVEYNAYAVL